MYSITLLFNKIKYYSIFTLKIQFYFIYFKISIFHQVSNKISRKILKKKAQVKSSASQKEKIKSDV